MPLTKCIMHGTDKVDIFLFLRSARLIYERCGPMCSERATIQRKMKRRNLLSGEAAKKSVQGHVMFVVILMAGAFFRIVSEDDIDGNTIMFAIILAIGVVIALSFFNQFVVDLCNDLNSKWTIINHLVPGTLLAIVILAFRIPIETFDVMLVVILFSIANLVMYSITKELE
jgi:hypothetical protein